MKFTEHLIVKLLNVNYEEFTSYCITAVSIAESDTNFNKKDLERIRWIIENVHTDLRTSIYKLDRFVDPTRFSVDSTKYSYPITFNSDYLKDPTDDSKLVIKLRSEDLQKYLCNAVQEINKLLYQNMSAYNEDFVMPKADNNAREGF